jgi:hypothetical protein
MQKLRIRVLLFGSEVSGMRFTHSWEKFGVDSPVNQLEMAGRESPRCCSREMRVVADNGKFFEAYCNNCRDVVYVRKPRVPKAQMMDE